ncbi:hypothetical protein [Butyrivibrio sp. LC3010]|uniref:hypothetical protein n=1 Tax=Butyrivibrio sp. LC3010 TaxID=1280680 RepID=UPI00047E2AB9|nr:hypothetical protein [Butyrivibrio sp. LC3010]
MYFVVHYYMLEKECLLAFFFFLSITLSEALHEHSVSQAGSLSEAFNEHSVSQAGSLSEALHEHSLSQVGSLSEAFYGLSGVCKNSDLIMKEVTYV